MKKYRILSISAVFTLLLGTGCSLNEYNPSSMSTKDEWTTPEGFEKKINDCYFDFIRIIYGQAEDSYLFVAEGGTDIWQDPTIGSNGSYSDLIRYNGFGASNGLLNEGYSGFYGVVSACNAAVYYSDKVEGILPEKRDLLLAEARFLRAHALFNIVEQWGGKYLPPVEPLTEPVTVLSCSSVNDFYTMILGDLEFAMQKLPVKKDQKPLGRVHRAAAYHLYAKACLAYSTYTDGLGNVKALTDAESKDLLTKADNAADYLIDNAETEFGVKLYDDVEDVFAESNNKKNEEALFVITHSSITALNPRGNYFNRVWKQTEAYSNSTAGIYLEGMLPSYDTEKNGKDIKKLANGSCRMMPSKYLIDLYGEKDKRYKAFFKDTYYVNNPTETDGTVYTWTEGDATRYGLDKVRAGNHAYDIELGDTAVYISRKTYTLAERNASRYAIYNIEDNYAKLLLPEPKEARFFPSLKKADLPGMYAGKPNKPYTYGDCIVYRLGETYLLSAEIKWRLNGNQANRAVKDRLDDLRNRACEGHDGSLDVTETQITKDFLLDEYAREMVGEWDRWMTLKRFRAFETRLALNVQIGSNFKKDVNYLRPIPTSELLKIDNASEYQNPGY